MYSTFNCFNNSIIQSLNINEEFLCGYDHFQQWDSLDTLVYNQKENYILMDSVIDTFQTECVSIVNEPCSNHIIQEPITYLNENNAIILGIEYK